MREIAYQRGNPDASITQMKHAEKNVSAALLI
jgi:hypothetical protein